MHTHTSLLARLLERHREDILAYAAIHQNPINRACHMIGIPMILGSIPLIPTVPPVGLGLFATGWAFQFAGHYFEGKKPEFTSKPINLVIGPVLVANDYLALLTGKRFFELPQDESPRAESSGEVACEATA